MPRLTTLASAFCAALALGFAAEAIADETLAAAGFSYRVTPGKDLPGGDFLGTYAGNASVCAIYCSSDARCVAYTFLSTPVAPGEPTCWLKSSIGGSVEMATASSGVRTGLDDPSAFLYGAIHGTDEPAVTRMGGSTYAKLRLTSKRVRRLGIAPELTGFRRDAAACSQLCERDARCVAMTVRRAGTDDELAMCYLADQVHAPSQDPDAHSSVKLGPPPRR
ncbi:MAG: hypothetical protein K1X88_18245 [Nannocystaceae bacterium]|nr:hypothetical protein [Nannocystaceae bacterium]